MTLLTGIKVPSADHYVYVGDRKLGATPTCSVRSFKVPVGEHTVALKDWSGLFGLNLLNRTARFPADQIVHILVDKGYGGAAHWAQISPARARDIAREIDGANKK